MNFLEMTGAGFWIIMGLGILYFWVIPEVKDLYKKYRRWVRK